MNEEKRIELTDEIVNNFDYSNIIAVTIAEGGAMGEPNGLEIVENDLSLYHTNLGYTQIDIKQLFKKITVLSSLKCSLENVINIEDGWKWFNMGFGNYLLVRSDYFDRYQKYIDENLEKPYEHGELYNKWYEVLKQIIK